MKMDIIEKTNPLETLESDRLKSQERLDAVKNREERNKLGQFATPSSLALEILEFARTLFPASTKVRFLDPAFGTGSFFSSLLRAFPSTQIASAQGFCNAYLGIRKTGPYI
jgi:adenine-specific DNA-methyltransferase